MGTTQGRVQPHLGVPWAPQTPAGPGPGRPPRLTARLPAAHALLPRLSGHRHLLLLLLLMPVLEVALLVLVLAPLHLRHCHLLLPHQHRLRLPQ